MSNHKLKSKEKYRLKLLIIKRDDFKCKICETSGVDVDLQIHHIIPIRDGGKNKLSNLILVCDKCHKELEK